MIKSDKVLTHQYLDWHAKLSGLPSVLTDKIRSKLYKTYKKETGNEPWQLPKAVINMSAEPCFSASGQPLISSLSSPTKPNLIQN